MTWKAEQVTGGLWGGLRWKSRGFPLKTSDGSVYKEESVESREGGRGRSQNCEEHEGAFEGVMRKMGSQRKDK